MAKRKLNAAARTALEQNAKDRLLKAASLPMEGLLSQYDVSLDGHKDSEVAHLREAYGENTVTKQKGDSFAKRLFSAFVNPFTVVLLVLAAISFFTDVVMADPGQKDPWSVVIVVVMVLISGILQFVQEARSGAAAEKLSEMVETTSAVHRDGKSAEELPIDEIVVGDIVVLTAGDMVPADLRVLQAKDLFVGQSSLTGESEPVEKFSDARATAGRDPLSMDNLAFMGSNVVSGSALALVVNVGDATIFGSIAHQLIAKKPLTSFEKGIRSVSWVLIHFMLIMVPVVFFLSSWRSGSWMDAFLFALSVAVGLTPAMLPTIVAAGLAKGATALSKQKVIPWDNVDDDFLKVPRRWDAGSISKFMLWMGPTSSVFDITIYLALYFWLCPMVCGGAYHVLSAGGQALFAMLFHTGWFVMSLWSQTLVIHMIRTPKVPFIQSRASKQVMIFGAGGIAVGTLLPYTPVGAILGMTALPAVYYLVLAATIVAYIALTTLVKRLYIRRHGELL